MKTNMLGTIANGTVDLSISLASAAAGGTVGAYAINHDICNDEDMSIVAGAVGGVGTYLVCKGILKTVKEKTVCGVNAVRTRLSSKSKAGSTK